MLPRRARPLLLCLLVVPLALVATVTQVPTAGAGQTAAVQAHLLWDQYSRADVERQMDAAKRAGAGMLRVDAGWGSAEMAGKGRWNSWYLAKMDHVVDEAEERGLELLITFWLTPCWASSAPETLKQGCEGDWWKRGVQRYPPVDAADYGDALAHMVRRYGNRVTAWEVWNEPNHRKFLNSSDRPGDYARILKAGYRAAKAADRTAKVIGGSLADADFEFTEALYAKGVKGHFDAWSVHPYNEDQSPLAPPVENWEEKSFSTGVPLVRETMLRHGDDKELWLTEFGWPTCNVRGDVGYRNCVDPDVQARYLREAFAKMQEWSYVPVGVWFNLQDLSPDPSDRTGNSGLLTHAGTEKPAFEAFQTAAQALGSRSTDYLHPAKMRVLRSRVLRSDRRLDVLAPITSRAQGEVKVTYQGDRRTDTFDAKVTEGDARLDRIRFKEPITRGQARLGTGIVTLAYQGDADTRPEKVRLRAASQPAKLDVEKVSLIGARLSGKGRVTRRAHGIVRFRYSYLDAAGRPQIHMARATIQDDGDWELKDDSVPPQLARHGGYLSILFTGYFERRIRGEMLAYELNPGQTRRP